MNSLRSFSIADLISTSPEPVRTGGRMAENGLYTNTTPNEIVVSSPRTNARMASPVTITGQARGSWFFEATAPVTIVDWDGRIIAEGYVEAQRDWMTEQFVPFVGSITFDIPAYDNRGAIILRAANPSGLSQYERAVEIPIQFFDTP